MIRTARVVGPIGQVFYGTGGMLGAGRPGILTTIQPGVSFQVLSVMAWGAHWWQIVSGPLKGFGIAYHDPSWDVR